jgi:hypothetical protein
MTQRDRENMSTRQRQIITRLIKNAELPLKKFGAWPSGDDEEEKQFAIECGDCGIIYISLNPKGPEPMEVQAFRQYQNHVNSKHR